MSDIVLHTETSEQKLIVAIKNDKPIRVQYQTMEGKSLLLRRIGAWIEKEPAISGVDQHKKYEGDPNFMNILEAEIARVIVESPITFKEMDNIFLKGLRGEYNEVPVLNAKNVRHWISSYLENERRELVKKSAMLEEPEERPEPSDEEKARIKEENRKYFVQKVLRSIEGKEAKIKDGSFSFEDIPANIDMGNIWYNRFVEKGYIEATKEEKLALIDRYMEVVRKELGPFVKYKTYDDIYQKAINKSKSHLLRTMLADELKNGGDLDEITNDVI